MVARPPLQLMLACTLSVGVALRPDASSISNGTLVATNPMSVARMAHTATTLGDGRVLIAGGFTGETNATRSAEAYSAATGKFSPLPRMRTPRHSHTATLLPNGKVLIVGGYGAVNGSDNVTLASAELFDPATNMFTPAGALRAARAGHVAVLLTNGKVLIAGGVGPNWSFLNSAELYDPVTGAFTATGSMTTARESHTAVRLRDGRVLIAGGHQGRQRAMVLYSSAELYDVGTGTFRPVGDMHTRRHKHDALLLVDGRVLISGGTDERDGRGVYRTTELFDPASGRFAEGPDMVRPRFKHNGTSVLLPNGLVLLAGGGAQAETYDATRRTFAIVAGAGGMGGQFSAVALLAGGRVLVTGGYGGDIAPQREAWVYQP